MEYDWERIILWMLCFVVIVGIVFAMSYFLCFTSETSRLNDALNGCIKCEYNTSNGNYYMLTCTNDSYKITEEQYLNLKFTSNISECK